MLCTRCALLVETDGLVGTAPRSTDPDASESAAPDAPRDDDATVAVDAGTDADANIVALEAEGGNARPGTLWTNGHSYLVVARPAGISWPSARAEAQAMGGHLVTLTSSAENLFVFALVADSAEVWVGRAGPWLGASQEEPRTMEPAGGWTWVSGEPWGYTAWEAPAQPDNQGGNEHFLHYLSNEAHTAATWNDALESPAAPLVGYVAEFE